MNIILIYSPEEAMREEIKAALENHLPLITTEDRDQCLEALKQKAPLHKAFLAVVDAEGTSALELFEEVKTLQPTLKIVAVGRQGTEAVAIEAVRLGADGYILLPLNSDAIMAAAR
ncbi:MAG: response regulator [Candidatus Omnitrophota bacterium]